MPLPLPLEDDPLSRELEPPPLLPLEDGAFSCVLEPPPLLLEDVSLSCELEPPPPLLLLLLLLLLEEEELSWELELPPPPLLLLEDDALSCGLSEAPGWAATAGLPPTSISASSAENVTSDTVLLTATSGTRWSCCRFRGVDSHRAFMSDLLSVRWPAAWQPGRRRGGPPSLRRDRRSRCSTPLKGTYTTAGALRQSIDMRIDQSGKKRIRCSTSSV